MNMICSDDLVTISIYILQSPSQKIATFVMYVRNYVSSILISTMALSKAMRFRASVCSDDQAQCQDTREKEREIRNHCFHVSKQQTDGLLTSLFS